MNFLITLTAEMLHRSKSDEKSGRFSHYSDSGKPPVHEMLLPVHG